MVEVPSCLDYTTTTTDRSTQLHMTASATMDRVARRMLNIAIMIQFVVYIV